MNCFVYIGSFFVCLIFKIKAKSKIIITHKCTCILQYNLLLFFFSFQNLESRSLSLSVKNDEPKVLLNSNVYEIFNIHKISVVTFPVNESTVYI